MKILSKPEWNNVKREPLQSYKDYESVISKAKKLQPSFTERINEYPIPDLFRRAWAAKIRAEQSLDLMIYSYSAGVNINNEIAPRMPECITFYQEFAKCNFEFEVSDNNDGHKMPHLDLYDTYYWKALQLVCFSILLGHTDKLVKIMDLLSHENDDQDALLEDLVAPYLSGRPGSTIYTRQLPYRKTRKIFQANPEERSALITQYLKEWYLASRREPYHDRHKSAFFPGYWSLEAGAITFLLDIDDSSYRDMPFYPKDLVDYARSVSNPPGRPQSENRSISRKASG
ncbi:PoNe immunity protein domain-containing protein, partial [Pseudomonas agarici]|uniref:PoNe immunity protein domain-containing protein n=2 Tax=Pseudomonas agarici TaxID=46677 RepID=UPI0008AF707B